MEMFWFFAVSAICILLYIRFVSCFSYWKCRGVPQYHLMVIFREMLLSMVPYRGIAEASQMIYNKFPKSRYCGFYQWTTPTLVLRDPDLIKNIAVKDFEHFVDHFTGLDENADPVWGKNLFSLKGEKWKDMRATLSPSFTSSKMKMMFGLISDYTKEFVKYFEERPHAALSLEIKDVFSRFSNDVIATTAFGVNCDSMRNPNNEFYLMGKKMTSFTGIWNNLRILFIMWFPRIAKKLKLTLFPKQSTNFLLSLIKGNMKNRERDNIVRLDMIHLLMEAQKGRLEFDNDLDSNLDSDFAKIEGVEEKQMQKRKKRQLSDVDITAQAFIFFFAGFDSVSTVMSFMAHELAINVDVQEKLQTEIDNTPKECDGTVSYATLSKMPYMDMVIAETMRKWSAGVLTDRVCTKPYRIEPEQEGEVAVTLKVGDVLWIPIFAIHRDPKLHPNPMRFDPERFSKENKAKIPPYGFFPFGVGPRSCIANRFALMEVKVLFFYLLNKFSVVVTDKTTVEIQLTRSPIQLHSKNGFWLGLKPRK